MGEIERSEEDRTWQFTMPKGWELIHRWGEGFCCREKEGGLRVIIDCEIKGDNRRWLHVSYSRKSYDPSHTDTIKIKKAFIGDKYAYAVFPPIANYVNIHAHCLHLWCCLDSPNGQILPEFSSAVPELGLTKSI